MQKRFDVQAVLQKADLVAYVEKAGGHLKKNGERYSCACPLHGGDNVTAFSIYFKDGKQLWNCFSDDCGGGDAISFVQKWMGIDFKRACEFILGETILDVETMKVSAAERLEAARIETIAAQEREDARRKELQVAERHLVYHHNLLNSEWMRTAWSDKGIDEGMQIFWTLGGCPDFFVDGEYHSPTLTIPVVNETNELMTIRHKIINPRNPKDKYRPDRTGLHSHPFLAVPEMGYDGDMIFVMEGEIKAMVTWTKANMGWQTIGVPGQEMYNHLTDKLKPVGKRVIVVPDPQAEVKAIELAHNIGGRILFLPQKVDDYILATGATQDDLYSLQKQARTI